MRFSLGWFLALLLVSGCENRVGSMDAGSEDLGPRDTGAFDAGSQDLGPAPGDAMVTDEGTPDLGAADLGPPDLGAGDLGGPDLGGADLGGADLGGEDLGGEDLGAGDLGSEDLGAEDSGAPDLGPEDSGAPDLGPEDLGPEDLGPPDLGAPDAGPMDAGDAGPLTCSVAPSQCTADEVCLGEACSCVQAIYGDHYLRTDGTVVRALASPLVITTTSGVDLDGITQIFIGSAHGCGLRNDGTVWCWPTSSLGNSSGQLGNGTFGSTPASRFHQATPVMVAAGMPLSQVMRINDGASRSYLASATCAVMTSGALRCWGSPDSSGGGGGSLFNDGVPGRRPFATSILAAAGAPLTGVKAVSLGTRHACVIRDGLTSDEVWCWGSNIGGALGLGDQTQRPYPTQVNVPGPAEQLGAGADATCARVADSVYCWGSNNSGQVGIGDRTAAGNHDGCINFCKLTPTQVIDSTDAPLNSVVSLGMGYLGVCALRADRSLWCWGRSTNTAQSERAIPAVVGGGALQNVAYWTTAGSSGYVPSIRYLNRDNTFYRSSVQVSLLCP